MTEASLRNSILSLMLADSLTVLMATRVSGSSLTTPLAMPSYTMPNDPWPSSRLREIFSRATSHSSGTYTSEQQQKKSSLFIWILASIQRCSTTVSTHRCHSLSAALKYSGLTDAYRTPFPRRSLFLFRAKTKSLQSQHIHFWICMTSNLLSHHLCI